MRFGRIILAVFWISFISFTGVITWQRGKLESPYWIAYVKEVDGNMDIYVRPADGGKSWRLTDHPDAESMPIWSPDGQWIAFEAHWKREDGLIDPTMYLMRPNGTQLRPLGNVRGFPGDRQAFWSPDSTHFFYFYQTAGHHMWQWNRINGQHTSALYISRLEEWDSNGTRQLQIQLSTEGIGSQLYWQNYISNSRSNVLAQFPIIDHPQWSPDDSWILFCAGDRFGQLDVYRVQANGENLQNLTMSDAGEDTAFWSPNGHWIYFSQAVDTDNSEIFRIRPNGSELEQVTNFTGSTFIHGWSPSKEWAVILNSSANTRISTLYLMSADGNIIELIHENIPSPASNNVTSWSPSGDAIAYRLENHCEIYNVLSKSRQVVATCGLWSPDGMWFIRFGGGNEMSIGQTNIETGEQQILSPMHWSFYPNTYAHYWSPESNAFNTFDQRPNSGIVFIAVIVSLPLAVFVSIVRRRRM